MGGAFRRSALRAWRAGELAACGVPLERRGLPLGAARRTRNPPLSPPAYTPPAAGCLDFLGGARVAGLIVGSLGYL